MNSNKTYHCTDKGMYYHVNGKLRQFIPYEKPINEPLKQSILKINSQLSQRQLKLFRECLYGLNLYSFEEISLMSKEEKMRIINVHREAQQLINLSKWQADKNLSDSFLEKIIAKSKGNFKKILSWFKDAIPSIEIEDNMEINHSPLRVLGKIENILNKLIEKHILPENFYQLE